MTIKLTLGNNGLHSYLALTTDGVEPNSYAEEMALYEVTQFVAKYNKQQAKKA